MVPIAGELFPHSLVRPAVPGEPLDPPSPLVRVQRGEVHEFHREAGRRSAQKPGNLNDSWISGVHLSEWESEIQPASDEELITRPRYSYISTHGSVLLQLI